MAFYELVKTARSALVEKITGAIYSGLQHSVAATIIPYFDDEDTCIRKTACLAVGGFYKDHGAL